MEYIICHKEALSSEPDIVTLGCEEQVNRRNVLKGLAYQKLIRRVMDKKQDDLSIRKIIAEISAKSTDYFIVLQPFKTQTSYFSRKWHYVHINEFSDYLEIWTKEQVVDRTWKKCSYCGQKIRADKQFSRKCRSCKKGWYHSSPEKKTVWKIKERGARERVLKILQQEGYLKQVSLKKRLDFFQYSDGVFEIFETKNKEQTGLTTGDLRKTLIYPFIVHHCGYEVKRLVMIYNGRITTELYREIRKGYGKGFPFEIELCPIGLYLKQRNIPLRKIKVVKDKDSYLYIPVWGNSEKMIIDLTEIC